MSPPAPPSPAIDVERAANLLEFYATSADRVGAVNDADLLRALAAALSSQPARIAEQPAAWAVFNVGGTLRGLYAARENAIDYANVVSGGRTVEPLYRAARSERDTGEAPGEDTLRARLSTVERDLNEMRHEILAELVEFCDDSTDSTILSAPREASKCMSELRIRAVTVERENAELRVALDEITEASSYPIDVRVAWLEAMDRARRALLGSRSERDTGEAP